MKLVLEDKPTRVPLLFSLAGWTMLSAPMFSRSVSVAALQNVFLRGADRSSKWPQRVHCDILPPADTFCPQKSDRSINQMLLCDLQSCTVTSINTVTRKWNNRTTPTKWNKYQLPIWDEFIQQNQNVDALFFSNCKNIAAAHCFFKSFFLFLLSHDADSDTENRRYVHVQHTHTNLNNSKFFRATATVQFTTF